MQCTGNYQTRAEFKRAMERIACEHVCLVFAQIHIVSIIFVIVKNSHLLLLLIIRLGTLNAFLRNLKRCIMSSLLLYIYPSPNEKTILRFWAKAHYVNPS